MNSALERLLSLRVQDVMNNDVTVLSKSAPMAKAAEVLIEEMISGAPVVGDDGRCVGVLTATDFVRRDSADKVILLGTGVCSAPGEDAGEADGLDTVERWMTPSVQSILATTSILSAARQMCGSHIHRLVVVDTDGKPIGVVTTLDMVLAMVLAFEE